MLCQQCQQREATLHFTKIVNGQVEEVHVCEQCAREKGKHIPGSNSFSIHDLLSGLLSFEQPFQQKQSVSYVQEEHCPTCNMTFEQVVKRGRFGCTDCYHTFKNRIDPILKRVHGGNTEHRGKVPKRAGVDLHMKKQIEELKRQLQQCVEKEAFEEAATIRDQIKRLEKQLTDSRGESS
ncbi:UvrB/UvrC motif-containing protein [Massilibacterium senegalense]|uniref:UvrB/UvrC motif-containing protein n=1 Tax=Massilibacterium senegalense TaxID=1632858 RepID=UPI000784BCA9|nr:UvrB/UvrC motif-containing protein [Massilibacterium senegalense]